MLGPAEIEEMMNEVDPRIYMGDLVPSLTSRTGATKTYVVLATSPDAAARAIRQVQPSCDVQILALSAASAPMIDRLGLRPGIPQLLK